MLVVAQSREETRQFACFLRGYGRFGSPTVEANEHSLVLEKNGRRSMESYGYANRIVVATSKDTEVAPGDRLRPKFNGRSREGMRLNNGELVTVLGVTAEGGLVAKGARGERKTLGADQRLFVRGYAATSYDSQGKTVDTADAGTQAATDARQWYVTT